MGQQQLLLIVLGMLIVGMAVYGSARVYDERRAEQSRDRITQEGMLLLQYADEYKARIRQLGGGGGTYDGFQLPQFFFDEPDVGYWVSASGKFVQVYACGFGADAADGEDGTTKVAVMITRNGDAPIQVYKLN